MIIEIIGTGSQGNAIIFCDCILLDAGIPYRYVKQHVNNIKIVLLTHIHGDHFNKDMIRSLYVNNENIKFCCGDFLFNNLVDMGINENRIITISPGVKYNINNITFSPFFVPHDCHNFGYRIVQNEHYHIHATDAFTLDGITAMNYDSATIEANHDLPTALSIINEKMLNGEFCHLSRAINTHLNVDKAIEFITKNNIKKWIPVHMGSSTKQQVMEKLNDIKCVSLI